MKKFALATLLVCATLSAEDIEREAFGSEKLFEPSGWPLQVYGDVDAVSKAKVQKKKCGGGEVQFVSSDAELTVIPYYNPTYSEAGIITLGYNYTYMKWNKNPAFNQTNFNTAYFQLGISTKRLEKWRWEAQLGANADTDHFEGKYMFYDFSLWGRYEYLRDVGVHVGVLAQSGMKIDRVYPIIGFDWDITPQWQLNLVYPVNISVVYKFNNRWSVAAAGRIFDTWHRTGKNEPCPQAIFEYRNTGAELALNYDYNSIATANLHVGSTFGGCLRISNRHHKHIRRLYLDPAGYVGGEVKVKF